MIIEIKGDDLRTLLRQLRSVPGSDIEVVRVSIDGGFKVKVNEDWWTRPLGQPVVMDA